MRFRLVLAAILVACVGLGGCAAVFVANQVVARASSDIDATDRAAIEAGNIGLVRDRYEGQAASTLSLSQLALLCDIYLKYQELGKAGDCLDSVSDRIATTGGARSGPIGRALPGKRAMLALALGQPRVALRLIGNEDSIGAKYVRALASIQSLKPATATTIAGQLRRYDEPAPLYYAASLYAALGDYASAREVLENPRGRLLKDYGIAGFTNTFGVRTGPGIFRLDVFDEFDFGVFGTASLAPAGNLYVEYLAAVTYLKTGGFREAERRLDLILAAPGVAGYRDVYWRALNDRAELALRAGDLASSERLLRQAIEVIERVRASVASEGARIAITGDKSAPYTALVDLLARRGAITEALVYAERAHSRTLVELLAGRSRFGTAAQGAVSGADRLVADYDRRAGEIQVSASASPGGTATRVADAYDARRRLQTSAPVVADLVTVAPVDVAAVQARLGPREAAIVFFDGPVNWHVFTIQPGRVSDHIVPDANITSAGVALRNALKTPSGESWRAPAVALYQAALAPAIAGLNVDSLIIVPSGILHYVPFAALNDGQQFTVDKFAIRTVPNLGLLTRSASGRRGGQALVIGNPLKGDAELSLPFAEKEAQDVASRLPGATLLLGRQATIAAFRAGAPGRDVIHFAGHGQFNRDQPLESRLLFTTADGRVDDLTARELYDLRTDAALVFLSACETGLNSLAGGQDIIGLQRGFFYSGSSAVIASLWEVSDQATAALVRAFYTAWLGGALPEQALRSAQIATRAAFPNPNYWAAFQISSVGGR
ncbi:MAG: CHAT domain-containing protein [Acetobacteraceae bacterium]|nr:CHAT domain-containing protein [Acetobacteraceae bacterium]